MADAIFLISEKYIKESSEISDNVAGKFLQAAIREAQERYKRIVGEALYNKIISLVANDTIRNPENAAYKAALDASQPFLRDQSLVELCNKVTFKIGNFGVAKSNDENLQAASVSELDRQIYYYQSKADSSCYDLQNYLMAHRNELPELSANGCFMVKDNLYSAATCGIFLGGKRGYKASIIKTR